MVSILVVLSVLAFGAGEPRLPATSDTTFRENLPADVRSRLEEARERMQARRVELSRLSAEEREAKSDSLRREARSRREAALAALPAEERARVEARLREIDRQARERAEKVRKELPGFRQ